VFVDIDEDTYNLDPLLVAEAITERTRAIIPVHFAGQMADMDAFTALAEKHGLHIIEDAAHAHGSAWRGSKAGGFGAFGSFSFQSSKVLTAGEGGILITNDVALAEAARSFCNQGRSTGGAWYDHGRLGTNYRMTGWQAAILLAQLERLPQQLVRRKANAEWLTQQLKQQELLLPPVIDERVTEHSFYLFMLRLNREGFPQLKREQVVKALQAEGMSCAPGYPHPVYRNSMFNTTEHRVLSCAASERACEEVFWLSSPMMLAEPSDLPDFLAAIEKISANADELARFEVQ
jgi:dTDP-4-amino-4,6-dideoxygalactose transaminase